MIVIVFLIIAIWKVINYINFKTFVKIFDLGNVLVSGMRGRGKDMAFCMLVNARKRDYISNVQYSDPKKRYKCFPLDLKVWDIKNNYTDFVDGTVNPYKYPYPDGLDYYISDGGIYFPAQYNNELDKRYKHETFFFALSRHLGNANVFINTQSQRRIWLKIREQSDLFVRMHSCKVFFKRVRLVAYLYDLEDSAEKGIIPPRFGLGKIGRDNKYKFEIAHGKIRKIVFWRKLPYVYDDRRFKKILECGSVWGDEI